MNSVDSVRAFLSPGLLRAHLSQGVPLFSRKEKNSHGGHGVHGGFDTFRACGSASFLVSVRHSFKTGIRLGPRLISD